MKISIPYPFLQEGRSRIQEAIELWEDKKNLLLCCPTLIEDSFLDNFHSVVLPRNSKDIGTLVPKCYIADMVVKAIELFPDEEWYGFGNSDCVPMGDLIENSSNHDILIFHRTNIKEWEHRFEPVNKDALKEKVLKMRQKMSDKRVARTLNREEEPAPNGEREWTYLLVEEFCNDQGSVYIQGQDLFLFRRNIVQQVLNDYLIPKDPILGTGAFDPRLTYWCMQNHKSVRVLHKLFHKNHDSEWTPDEIEFEHNGGTFSEKEWPTFFEDEFLIDLCKQGHRGAMSGWFVIALKKYNRPMWDMLIGD